MELVDKIVRFDQWCPKCRYIDQSEDDSPCDLCLEEPGRANSRKPLYWKPSQGNEDYLPPQPKE